MYENAAKIHECKLTTVVSWNVRSIYI